MSHISWDPKYNHPVPVGHKFPMDKYDLIPQDLVAKGIIEPHQLKQPAPVNRMHLLKVHEADYIEQLSALKISPKAQRKTGFIHSKELIEREEIITQGTIDAAVGALNTGVGFNIAGGTHHAFSNRGEGFCLYNDQAVAARFLQEYHDISNILIIDLDVHQGNGTAQIFQHDSTVFTLSIHGKSNYPFQKEQSDIDIDLNNGTDDNSYLSTLYETLNLFPKLFQPEFVFYQAGVDVLASDKFGTFNLSLDACATRDEFVFSFCQRNNLPVCVTMGGGYSPEIKDIVSAHIQTFKIGLEFFC